ncbi:hypothetical protein PHLGIDRAFT_122568 [Phlebiopsis gigantea 11061_1 CR5-6]|uniref:Uncharacterized protein n=1 Tax=Phlebiopsis gigantea (strain 11061_1 CR5-6) TaxID=745531 RepID=A0A0C3PBJ1_PHLG1|nr:hypothetical protein PHLGIDRAFT_122568 [Phlebiopsis gigantea 11061_1 CR5-6]
MPNTPAAICFTFLSTASFILIYLIPPSADVLFPAFQYVRDTGTYPDGLEIRRSYTGVTVLDEMCTGLAGFFSAAVDGHDEATRMYCLWFLPQLVSILVFLYWEASRVSRSSVIAFPTFFGILAQLITAGVVLPFYFAIHILLVPLFPIGRRGIPHPEARALLPAVIMGFLVPSAMLFLFPASPRIPLDVKQIIAALWQPFPIYLAVIHNLLSKTFHNSASIDTSPTRIDDSEIEAFPELTRAYLFSGVLCTLSHWTILLPSVFASDPSWSFVQIFVPYPLHAAIGAGPAHVAPYRLSIRLLFQNDCLMTTIAAMIFFGWSHSQMSRSTTPMNACSKERYWIVKMVLLTFVGGPGASIAWAALEREKLIIKSIVVSDDLVIGVGNLKERN